LLTPPVPQFTTDPQNPIVGQAITFNATASEDPDGKIVKYAWNFRDGNTTTIEDRIITHTYTTAGEYEVILTVVDDHGISMSYTAAITVNNQG
jgi:PKD repeat protein